MKYYKGPEAIKDILDLLTESENTSHYWNKFSGSGKALWKEVIVHHGITDFLNGYDSQRLATIAIRQMKFKAFKLLRLDKMYSPSYSSKGVTVMLIPSYSKVTFELSDKKVKKQFKGSSSYLIVVEDDVHWTINGQTRNGQPILLVS